MSRKTFTVTRAQARDLKRIDKAMSLTGGTPHALVRRQWLADMTRELRRMAAQYDGTPRKAKELFEALVIAETEGVPGVADLMRRLGDKVRRKQAA